MDYNELSRRSVLLGAGTVIGTANGVGALSSPTSADQQGTTRQETTQQQTTTQNGPPSLAACTFNIRWNNPEDTFQWTDRLPRVAETIDRIDPDLLGIQEAQPEQFIDLQETLTDYEWFGLGREGGDDSEAVPIAWPSGRFNVEAKGVFWLSPTPDQPSIGWDADLPRISTWATLQDDQTDTTFWFCNTHFSHVGPVARRNSANIIRRRALQRAENGYRPVVTGDLNAIPSSPPYRIITGQTGAGESPLVDGRRDAGTKNVSGPWGTFHDFTGEVTDRIDYVFTPRGATVHEYRTLDPREGDYRSDHLPVIARFSP